MTTSRPDFTLPTALLLTISGCFGADTQSSTNSGLQARPLCNAVHELIKAFVLTNSFILSQSLPMSTPTPAYGAPPPSNPDTRPLPDGWITQFDNKYVLQSGFHDLFNELTSATATGHGQFKSSGYGRPILMTNR